VGTGGKRFPVEGLVPGLPPLAGPPSLYVHVPFCRSKCPYCDFYSLPAGKGVGVPPQAQYLELLKKEWNLLGGPGPFPTIYTGGGTPSVLEGKVFSALLDFLSSLLAPGGEWTLEANPESLEREKLQAMKEAGVTRLSLGVQSLEERNLRFLGRIHDARRARAALEEARRLGPPDLSADLILGLPGQEEENLLGEIDGLLQAGVNHLSFYLLTLEPGTPLQGRASRGEVSLPGEEKQASLLLGARAALESRGLRPYEISNAARPGRECLHNLRYWLGGDYLGLGPSAAGLLEGKRWRNPASLEAWARALEEGRPAREEEERLPPFRAASERVWLQLRTCWGTDLEEVRVLTGAPPSWEERAREKAAFLASRGLLEEKDGRFRLTERGVLQADGIGAAFLALS